MPIAARVLGSVALATFATQALGEDDLPIVGTYTENTPYTGDGSDVSRVTITAHDINSVWSLHYPQVGNEKVPPSQYTSNAKAPTATRCWATSTSPHAMTRPSISQICIRPIEPHFTSARIEQSMRSWNIVISFALASSRRESSTCLRSALQL